MAFSKRTADGELSLPSVYVKEAVAIVISFSHYGDLVAAVISLARSNSLSTFAMPLMGSQTLP